jgi:hypothetical protein
MLAAMDVRIARFARTHLLALSCASCLLAAVVAGCTDGTTPDCAGDAGCGPQFDGPPPEGSGDAAEDADAAPDVSSEATSPDAAPDTSADGAGAGDGATG